MNPDFVDLLRAFADAEVRFLVVGAYALAHHGRPRATGDLDIWVRPSRDNAARVWSALLRFGAPLNDLKPEDLSTPDVVFQIGVPPHRIDILTQISGVEFEAAWERRVSFIIDGQRLPFIGRQDLLANKRAAGRPRDLADVAELEDSDG